MPVTFAAVLAISWLVALAALGPAPAAAQTVLDPGPEPADALSHLYRLVFAGGVIVFLAVEGAILAAAWRSRPGQASGRGADRGYASGGQRADGGSAADDRAGGRDITRSRVGESRIADTRAGIESVLSGGHSRSELVWTVAPAVVVLMLAALSYRTIVEAYQPQPDTLAIEATGRKWFWEFTYPKAGVTTANQLVVPVGVPVEMAIGSADVLHSFWIPALGDKVDAVPAANDPDGEPSRVRFVVQSTGSFEGECVELCGSGHDGMGFTVVALAPEEFEEWVAAQALPAATPEPGSIEARGLEIAAGAGACGECHTVRGVAGLHGDTGPNLTHVGSRALLAGEVFQNDSDGLSRWIDHPPDLKPGTTMVDAHLTADQISAIVAYLSSLR